MTILLGSSVVKGNFDNFRSCARMLCRSDYFDTIRYTAPRK